MLVALACGDDAEEANPTDSPTPTAEATPSPTASAASSGEISWDEAKELLADCRVTGVTQTHALDIYLMLDDGTEVHAVEPSIDLIFSEIDNLPANCRPRSIATE